MAKAAELIAQGQRVAVMFGPERAGLENEDIARANAIVSVPVNPQFASLNLAQCVLLMGYEWMRAQADIIWYAATDGTLERARLDLCACVTYFCNKPSRQEAPWPRNVSFLRKWAMRKPPALSQIPV